MAGGNQSERQQVALVVDDEEEVRGYMRYVLKSTGYRVMSARDSIEALEQASEFHGTIDILVTDVHMKIFQNGLGLASCFGLLHPETRIILTSGSPLPEDAVGPIRFLPFLPKPFTPGQLLAAARGGNIHSGSQEVPSQSEASASWVPG